MYTVNKNCGENSFHIFWTHSVVLQIHKEEQFLLRVLYFLCVYCVEIMHNMFFRT